MKIRGRRLHFGANLSGSPGLRHSASVIIASVSLVNGEELRPASPLNVVLFSGGRGSAALARQLVSSPGVNLTIVINGYDDGASTGEVRRFLGDSLGPSDFRKNASNLAAALHTCPAELIAFLDRRCPSPYEAAAALSLLDSLDSGSGGDAFAAATATLFQSIAPGAADCCRRDARALRAGDCGHRAPVRLRRLQPRQSRVRRRVPACRTRLQSRGRRLLRARRSAAGHRRECHRRHQCLSGRRGRRRAPAGDGRSDRRCGAAQQHSRDLPRRPAADCGGDRCDSRAARWHCGGACATPAAG